MQSNYWVCFKVRRKLRLDQGKRNWSRQLNWAAVCLFDQAFGVWFEKFWAIFHQHGGWFKQVWGSTFESRLWVVWISCWEVDSTTFGQIHWHIDFRQGILVGSRYFDQQIEFSYGDDWSCKLQHAPSTFLTLNWWFKIAPSQLKPWMQIPTRQFKMRIKKSIVDIKVVSRNLEKVVFIPWQSARQRIC